MLSVGNEQVGFIFLGSLPLTVDLRSPSHTPKLLRTTARSITRSEKRHLSLRRLATLSHLVPAAQVASPPPPGPRTHHPNAIPSRMSPTLAAPTSFYKRPLPDSCIPFNSPEGRDIFAHALAEQHLDSYFLLSQHFLTQNEPAYCALGTLAMILNALEMDPQRVWKGPWRFYDQDMLDCCRPLSDIAQVGLTLAEFACLARCNGLTARTVSPPTNSLSKTSREASLDQFRADLKKASRGKGTMAISYSRKALGQTGSGHFSPIGAYSEKDDKVLILDVARCARLHATLVSSRENSFTLDSLMVCRFKYPSYWVPTELAYSSMEPIDVATGQPRGYVMLDVAPSRDIGTLAGKQSLTTLTLNKAS